MLNYQIPLSNKINNQLSVLLPQRSTSTHRNKFTHIVEKIVISWVAASKPFSPFNIILNS